MRSELLVVLCELLIPLRKFLGDFQYAFPGPGQVGLQLGDLFLKFGKLYCPLVTVRITGPGLVVHCHERIVFIDQASQGRICFGVQGALFPARLEGTRHRRAHITQRGALLFQPFVVCGVIDRIGVGYLF